MLCPRAGNEIAIAFFLREDAVVTLSPRGRVLSHKAFHIFFKFLVSTFKCKAICFLDSGLRLLLVELLHAVSIALLAPVRTAEIRSNQRKSTTHKAWAQKSSTAGIPIDNTSENTAAGILT